MEHTVASAESTHKMAALGDPTKGAVEVYDETSNSFFIAKTDDPEKPWHVERKPGRGSKRSEDWQPLEIAALAQSVNEWMARQEERGVVIVCPWDVACLNSPSNRAMRTKKDGLLMLRTGDKVTWTEELGGTILSRVPSPFKQYDGWEPVPDGHFYAKVDLSGQYTIRFDEGGRLGTKAFTSPATSEAPAPKKKKGKVPNPNAAAVTVAPETLTVAAAIAQSLAAAIASTSGETQKSLAAELTRISSHVSWHLREDRAKYRPPEPAHN